MVVEDQAAQDAANLNEKEVLSSEPTTTAPVITETPQEPAASTESAGTGETAPPAESSENVDEGVKLDPINPLPETAVVLGQREGWPQTQQGQIDFVIDVALDLLNQGKLRVVTQENTSTLEFVG